MTNSQALTAATLQYLYATAEDICRVQAGPMFISDVSALYSLQDRYDAAAQWCDEHGYLFH